MSAKPLNAARVGISNKKVILNMVRYFPGITRKELANKTGLNPSTVTNIINFLKDRDLLFETGKKKSENPGRNSVKLLANKKNAKVFLVKIGVEKSHIGIGYLDNSYELISDFRTPDSAEALIEQIHSSIVSDHEADEFIGISFSVPGIVDRKTGEISNLPHLNWKNVKIKKLMQEKFGEAFDVFIENEAKLALKAEMFLNEKLSDFKDGVYLYITQGVGGAILIDRKLFSGFSFTAGELGHMSIDMNGPRCKCGNRGCLECYLSVEEIVKEYERANGRFEKNYDVDKFIELMDKVEKGEPLAKEIITEYYKYLKIGLINIVNLLNPEFIVIGGVGNCIPIATLEQIEEKVQSGVISSNTGKLKVFPSSINMVNSALLGETLTSMDVYCNRIVLE
jgi:predicted NBD/HSP70 family sugar kinase